MARAESFEEDPVLLREMGILYYDMRVDDRSIEATERALERAPNDDLATYYLASARMRSGQRDVAIQLATDLIRRNPEFLGAYIVRGRGELLRNYFDRAAADVQFVLQRDPSNYDALVLEGDLSHAYARQTAQPTAADETGSEATVYDAAGTAHLNEAVLSYEQALAINPNGFEAADHLGDVLFAQLNWQAYVDLIEPRLRDATTGANWRERLAQAYLATGRLNDCLMLRSEVALEQSTNAELNLGVARLALDSEGHAMTPDVILRHASAAYQNSNRSLPYILVIVDAYLNENNCTQAENYLETAVRAFPSNPDVRRRVQAVDDCP
jgi:tetratricopeptide (TPR) repeat protein